MTHKEQYIRMLEAGGIDFYVTGGDKVVSHGCVHRFSVSGDLKEVFSEGGEYDDNDY